MAPLIIEDSGHISQAQYPELLSIDPKICCNYFRRELYLPLLLLLRSRLLLLLVLLLLCR